MTQQINSNEFSRNLTLNNIINKQEQNFSHEDYIPISNTRELEKLIINFHQDRNPTRSSLREIYGLDTETNRNGDVILIADNKGNYLDKINPDSLLQFMFSKRYQGSWNFFYNLGFDAEVIIKIILGKELKKYLSNGRKLKFNYNNFVIDYIPRKKLAIRKGHHSAVFFDLAQYYRSTLVDAYQDYVWHLPEDYLKMKDIRDRFSATFYKRNPKQFRKYCIEDCMILKALAIHWIRHWHEMTDFYPMRWISGGNLAEKFLINSGIYIPKFNETLTDVQKIAWQAYYGGRFEILKRGFIGTAYSYDINSAYPFSFANIPDITKGKWKKLKHFDNHALLGFYKIEGNIPLDEYVPPFPFRTGYNRIIFPSGNFITYVSHAELQACSNRNWYKILESWQYFDNNPVYPFKNFIEKLYKKRLQYKDEDSFMEYVVKLIINSIYGKTAQSNEGKRIRFGNLFNPVIASTITGTTRAMLYAFIQKHNTENETVSFATDSIITTKKIDIDSNVLGGFKLDKFADDVYVLQNGVYRFNGKWKNRGIGKLKGNEVTHSNTITKNGKLYLVLKRKRPKRLVSSICTNSIEKIGKFEEIIREINLNADHRREWSGDICSLDDKLMNNSIPLTLPYYAKEIRAETVPR